MSSVQASYGQTPLLQAAQAGDDGRLAALLLEDPHLDVNGRDYHGRTPLSLAAENGYAAVVSQLLRHGANPNLKDLKGVVPLWYATHGGHVDAVRVLLESAQLSDVNPMHAGGKRDEKAGTPLSIALKKGYRDIFDLLVRVDGVDPFVQIELDDHTGHTASVIGLAVRKGYEDVALALLDKFGSSIGSSGSQGAVTGSELLVLAASVGSTQLVETLLAQPHAIDPNTIFPYDDYRLRRLTPFVAAVDYGHRFVVRLLLDTKCIPPDTLSESVFRTNKRDIVKMLLEDERVEADRKNSEGRTPLSIAAEHGYETVVEEFLAMTEKVDPDSRDNNGRTPLTWAVGPTYHYGCKASWEKELTVVRLLLASGRVDPNPADEDGITPLFWAAKNGAESIVEAILEWSGTDPDADCGNGSTPLALAASEGHAGVVEVLLRTGKVDINATRIHNGGKSTALSLAAKNGYTPHKSVTTLLLSEPGINPNKKNDDGATPLAMAAEENDLAIARELLAAGADPNSRDNLGVTPLHHAVIPYHVTYEGHAANMVKELLELNGIDPDPIGIDGRTPLSLAAERGHAELVDIFIATDSIDPDSRDATGRSPLSWAIAPGRLNNSYDNISRRKEVVRRLLQVQTVDPNAEDAEGLTPLLWAIQAKHGSEFVGLLLTRSDLDIQRQCRDGRTPMAVARELESTATISMLRAGGALDEASSSTPLPDTTESLTHNGNENQDDDDDAGAGADADADDNDIDGDKGQGSADDDESDENDEDDDAHYGDVGETTKHRLEYDLSRSIRLPLGTQQEYTGVVEDDEADLCPKCASIDLDAAFSDRDTRYQGRHIADLGNVDETWSTRKCPLCRLIAAVRPVADEDEDGSKNNKGQYRLIAFSSTGILICSDLLASWQLFQDPWIDTMMLGVVRDPSSGRVASVRPSGFIARAGSNCPYGTQAITVPLLASRDEMDFETTKGWISCCSETHSKRCNPRRMAPVPHFYLIDCTTRRIVQQGERLAAPAYAALSYVWGQPLTTNANPAVQTEWIQGDGDGYRFLRPLADGGVEPVVEDAIHVALGLGYQHLWVDRYCIDQAGDAAVKQEQLQSMHLVYANAHVTLVMAAGQGASFGLAGATHRQPRAAVPSARVKGHRLTCIPPEPRAQIQSSAWSERGWTYQEGLFARRRVFFSEFELTYECRSLVCREAILLPPHVLQLMGHRWTRPRLMKPTWVYNGRGVMAAAKGGFDLFERLTSYTTRRLTYQSDALNAMLGILQAFAQRKRYPVYNLCGVPVLCATNALGFEPWSRPVLDLSAIRSRGGDVVASVALAGFVTGLCWNLSGMADRRPEFPSWSWTGWCGVVSGQPPAIVSGSGFDVDISVVLDEATVIPWDDCYRRLVQAVSKEVGAPSDVSFSDRHYVLCIRACVVTARLYEKYDTHDKTYDWKGIVAIGDSVWDGYYYPTRNDCSLPSDFIRPREDGTAVTQNWRQRLLEESWLGIVLQLNDKKEQMRVLIVQEQHPPAVNVHEHTYWERVGLLCLSDISLESSILERRTLMLM